MRSPSVSLRLLTHFDVLCDLLLNRQTATWNLLLNLTSRGMKSYSDSRTELRDLQILKKMLEKSSQFLLSEQPCEPKILDVGFTIAGVERIRSENMRLCSTLEAI